MKDQELDTLDKAIVAILGEDGRTPIKKMADTLGVTTPTLRSRLNALIESKIIKIAALIDPSKIEGVTTAIIGISIEKGNLEDSFEKIAGIDQVNWTVAVTGRYDIIAQVTFAGGISGLYKILRDKLNKIKGIKSTETFVLMEARNKRVFLPDDMKSKWFEDYSAKNRA